MEHAASSSPSNASELASYLDCDTINQLDDTFDLLKWWHEHKLTYPVLSIMAKDILTVPVSTISLESTFSMTDRIIEEQRMRLNVETVEWLTCIKDWELAEARLQHNVEDPELEEMFEDLYLDSWIPWLVALPPRLWSVLLSFSIDNWSLFDCF